MLSVLYTVPTQHVSIGVICFGCFFKQKTAYEMRISDWSSDVCSSDLVVRQTKGIPDRSIPPCERPRKSSEFRVTRSTSWALSTTCTRRSEARRVGTECVNV